MSEIETVLPAFLRFPGEAAIVGRLLAGYGELEWELHSCLGLALGSPETAARALFRMRGEEQRILVADALMRQRFNDAGLAGPYAEAIADMSFCRTIRNQYAHCHWWDEPSGLSFVDMEAGAKKNAAPLLLPKRPVGVPILRAQEEYFRFVQRCFWHLQYAFKVWSGEQPGDQVWAAEKSRSTVET